AAQIVVCLVGEWRQQQRDETQADERGLHVQAEFRILGAAPDEFAAFVIMEEQHERPECGNEVRQVLQSVDALDHFQNKKYEQAEEQGKQESKQRIPEGVSLVAFRLDCMLFQRSFA